MDGPKKLSLFLLGLGVGFGLGMIFAPRSGSESRDYLKSKAGEGRDWLEARERFDSASELFERGRQAMRDVAGDNPTRPKRQMESWE